MEDEYLWVVKDHGSRSSGERNFPYDHLGVGDRLIFNRVIRKWAKHFKKYAPRGKANINAPQTDAINVEMEGYGFRPLRTKERVTRVK